MVDTVNDFVQKLTKDLNGKSSEVDFLDELNALSLQIICKTAMGYKLSFEDASAQQYRQVQYSCPN